MMMADIPSLHHLDPIPLCLLSPKCCRLTFPQLRIERHSCITSLLSLPFPIPRSTTISCPLYMLTLWPNDWQFSGNASLFATQGIMRSEDCKWGITFIAHIVPACCCPFQQAVSLDFFFRQVLLLTLQLQLYTVRFGTRQIVTKYWKSVAKEDW